MHYAISYQYNTYEFLHSTPRKKSLKHSLIRVEEGLVLVKLGKMEYAVEAGMSFWLPFDSLSSLTFTPNSKISKIEVSSRVTLPMPKQGGFIQPSELLTALLNRLISMESPQTELELLSVLKNELALVKPSLAESKLTRLVSQWKIGQPSKLDQELQLVLKVREAHKMMQSGKKREFVVDNIFDGKSAIFSSLEELVLGVRKL